MDVSIVIPTKNAGALFDKVLERVFQQETNYTYEVICVDSGSSDGTLDIIKKYPCLLYQIPASEFGHGKTRVYGASKGTGEYIIFITQDAMPASQMRIVRDIRKKKGIDICCHSFQIIMRAYAEMCLKNIHMRMYHLRKIKYGQSI